MVDGVYWDSVPAPRFQEEIVKTLQKEKKKKNSIFISIFNIYFKLFISIRKIINTYIVVQLANQT